MNAIFLKKYGDPEQAFEQRELKIPEAGPGEVTIKVEAFGINFADVLARRGLYPDAPKNPALLGYDVAGTIYQIGEGVNGFSVGQRVTAMTRFGGYAEYAKTVQEGVAVIPDDLDCETATALTTQGCTAYYCAAESVQLHRGDKVLIQAAAGGVGTILVQIAKHKGCYVYGTASTKKQEYLKQIGVDFPIDYKENDFAEVINNHLGASALDVVFDSLGGKIFKKGMKLLGPGGRMVFFGAASQARGSKTSKLGALRVALGFGFWSPIPLIMKSQGLIGVNMLRIADHRPHVLNHCLKEVIKLTDQGVIKPNVGKVFQAEEIAEAHDYLESRRSTGKVVLKWT